MSPQAAHHQLHSPEVRKRLQGIRSEMVQLATVMLAAASSCRPVSEYRKVVQSSVTPPHTGQLLLDPTR